MSTVDLCCWVESVESLGCLAYLMLRRWQKPSACIKVHINIQEKPGLGESTIVETNNGSSSFFYIYSAQQVPATAVSLPPLTPRGCSFALYERKVGGRGGGSCRLGLGTWIQSWRAVGSSGVKVFSGEFLMFPTSWLFPDLSSASAEMSSTQLCLLWLRCSLTLTGHTQMGCVIPFREAHPTVDA